MISSLLTFASVVILAAASPQDGGKNHLSDAKIKKILIKESISEYPGNCPCPYNTAKNGSNCGRRSAYSRPGGYAPLCFDKDITPEMVKEWRESHK